MASNGTTRPEARAARWRRDDFDPGPASVGLYRMFDAGGDLLYVGISRNLIERWRSHRREAAWWHDVETIAYEWHADRYRAEVAEKAAIRTERPLFNIALVAA